jgi:DNA-binding NarL/FixJ family response regulator
MSNLRILVADDHALVRSEMRALIAGLPDVEVVAETGNGDDALRLIGQERPDVALIDISMPGLNGLEVAGRAGKEHPATRIVMLSMHADDEFVRRALVAGAVGYLLKDTVHHELEPALRAILRGEIWLSPEVAKAGNAVASGEALTDGQREVLKLIAEGLSTQEIASRLRQSAASINATRSELMRKLGIPGTAGLVRYAVRMGMVEREP